MAEVTCTNAFPNKKWSAIVLTCQSKDSAHAFQKELEIYQKKGFIDPEVLVLIAEDPRARVGSGGATLNALLIVTEHLSAQEGFSVVNSTVLDNANILIMHMGRDYPFSSCGRAFTTFPAKHASVANKMALCDGLVCNIDALLQLLSNTICSGAPSGVWVCSTDMILTVDSSTRVDWSLFDGGITMILLPSSTDYACHHGVVKLGSDGKVKDIIFRGTDEEIKKCVLESGKVPLVSGVVYISTKAAEKMLFLHGYPPLDACTYYGLDNGAEPIQLSLFFDILLCMADDVCESDFVQGNRSGVYGRSTRIGIKQSSVEEKGFMKGARALLYKQLRGIPLTGVIIDNATFDYMVPQGSCYRRQILRSVSSIRSSSVQFEPCRVTHTSYQANSCTEGTDGTSTSDAEEKKYVAINSHLDANIEIGKDSVVSHCRLQGKISFGQGTVLSGVEPFDFEGAEEGVTLPPDIVLAGYNVSLPSLGHNSQNVLVAFGVHDDLQVRVSAHTGTICNKPWKEFFSQTGISADELWLHDLPEDRRCLFNARLFPVCHAMDRITAADTLWLLGCVKSKGMLHRWRLSLRLSLKEILAAVNLGAEFARRRSLWFDIGRRYVERTLLSHSNDCLVPFFRSCTKEGYSNEILEALDHVACTTSSPGIAARTLACVADVLGSMAGEKAGLRSGPARNEAWTKAFKLLEIGDINRGVRALAAERSKWLDRPDLLIRAARHYEGAEQILIRNAVMSAKKFVDLQKCDPVPMGQWVIAECPARLDLAGGWSDTPPVTYEHEGAVVNVAVTMDGKRPIGAKVRRIPEPEIVLVLWSGEHSVRIVCKELSDLANYTHPNAPGALLKACFCFNLITLPSDQALAAQLKNKYGGGFELHTWSNLPVGSGLGTSSILAGAVMAAILRSAGYTADKNSLVHIVLYVEQMITTGGGWQDNVGGFVEGVKIGRSKGQLPLRVDTTVLDVSEDFIQELDKKFVLIYTGKTRLAKNLLQDVVRNWYARLPEIRQNADDLVENAEQSASAFLRGDIEQIGECLNKYWLQKKLMAPGSEPVMVRRIMDALQPYTYGQSLVGAGGGGFLYVITKQPNMREQIRKTINSLSGTEDVTVHEVSIDRKGISITIEES